MSSSSSHRRRRSSSSGSAEARAPQYPGGLAIFLTTVLLAVILMTGPMILGAARIWVELPLMALVTALMFVQGVRLSLSPTFVAKRVDAIDLTVLLFVLYTIVRWLTSPTEYFSRIEALDVVGYATVFLTCRHGMANRKYAVFLLYLLVILGVGETVFGYYLSAHLDWFPFGPSETKHVYYAPRWIGTYGCPNNYGSLLVMAMGAALALGSLSKLPWPVRIVLLYLAIMIMGGVIYSASRGSWLALIFAVIGLVIFGIRNGTMRWWIPVVGAAVLALAAWGLFNTSSEAKSRMAQIHDIFTGDNFFTYVRVELARDALHIAKDNLVAGTGPATFIFVHPRYQDSTFAFEAVFTHNDYLNCLADYGLIGFTLAMLFVALVTLKFFRPLDIDHRWHDRVLVATGFAAWAAYLIHSTVDFNLHIPANALLLFGLVGLALGRFKEEESVITHWSTFSLAPLGRGVGWAVILFSLVYGTIVVRSMVSDLIYEPANTQKEEVANSESMRRAQDALAWDRGNANAWLLLGDLHRNQAARQMEIENRLDDGQQALDAYKNAYKANPLDDTIQARMGMTFDVMRRFPEAFFCYEQAVKLRPYDGQFWYRLGNHFWGRSMWVKAEESYIKAMTCPYGAGGTYQAEQELRRMPQMDGVPLPPKNVNPLESSEETDRSMNLP